MEIISTIIGSAALMYILAFVFAIFFIRCLIACIRGGESSLLVRIIGTVIFAGLVLFFYLYAGSLTAPNPIDGFLSDTWLELKKFVGFVETKL